MTVLGGTESTIVKQASDDLKRLSVMFSGILKIAPVLDQVVSLQQAAEESEGRVKVARELENQLKDTIAQRNGELAGLDSRIAAAKTRAKNAESEAVSIVKSQVDEMKSTARSVADGLVDSATQRAAAIVADAERQSKEMMDRTNAEVAGKKAELVDASAALEKIRGDLTEAQKHWDGFRAKVAS